MYVVHMVIVYSVRHGTKRRGFVEALRSRTLL